MISYNNVLDKLLIYQKEEFDSMFLNNCINYFKNNINNKINEIIENEIELSSLRIYLLYNLNNYKFILLNNKINNLDYTHRVLNFSDNQINNLISMINNDKIIDCNKYINKTNNNILYNKMGKYYFYIVDKDINLDFFNDGLIMNYDNALFLIGIESLYFLEHKNLNYYCNSLILNNNKIINNLDEINNIIRNNFNNIERERIIINNSIVYHLYGIFYNSEIDLLIILKNNQEINKFNILKKYCKIDFIYYNNDNNIIENKFYINELPNILGIDNIFSLIINVKLFFNYNNIKCFSLYIIYNINKSKNQYLSLLDTYLLKLINNINFYDNFCFHNLIINNGKPIVLNDKTINNYYNNIIDFLKKYYDINVDIIYLKNHFKKCIDLYDTIYLNKKQIKDDYIKELVIINRNISNFFIYKYGFNVDYLLDIGAGKLSGLDIYKKSKIKNLYCIEPSIYSLEIAKNKIKNIKNMNIKLIQGFGDRKFNLNKKFNIIVLIFTIHYMIDNIDILLDNIINHSNKDTIIIITFLNINENILNDINKNNKYEIEFNNEVYWGLYKFNDDNLNKGLFYFKNVYGLESGSNENIINNDIIKNIFLKTNKFNIIYENNFLNEYNINNNIKKFKIKNFQKRILELNYINIYKLK